MPLNEASNNLPVSPALNIDEPCVSNTSSKKLSLGLSPKIEAEFIPSLPIFSYRMQCVLKSGKISMEFDKFVEECAYHVLSEGKTFDTKSQYDKFGQKMFAHYPCIAYPGNTTEYVSSKAFTVFLISAYPNEKISQ